MGKRQDRPDREFGMSWDEIQQYDRIIVAIATKYCGDSDLRNDIAQEVRLKLHTDKRLDISRFKPSKRDAAIRNTIRNKILTALNSKKIGRWPLDSLELLSDMGVQVDSDRNVVYPHRNMIGRPIDASEGEEA